MNATKSRCQPIELFWYSATWEAVKRIGVHAFALCFYLQCHPSKSRLGVYPLRLAHVADALGISEALVSETLMQLEEARFCRYDREKNYIWVCETIEQQFFSLKLKDKRTHHVWALLRNLPSLSFMDEIYLRYAKQLYLHYAKPPFTRVHHLMPQLKNEIEAEKTSKKMALKEGSKKLQELRGVSEEVILIFKTWQSVLNHPRAKLDYKRRKIIERALKLYSVMDLCKAIQGCSLTPYNMGNNPSQQRYDDIALILRDSSHIERFIRNSEEPPLLPSPDSSPPRRTSSPKMHDLLERQKRDPTFGAL